MKVWFPIISFAENTDLTFKKSSRQSKSKTSNIMKQVTNQSFELFKREQKDEGKEICKENEEDKEKDKEL